MPLQDVSLELRTGDNDKIIVMSTRAYEHFTPAQRLTLEKYGRLIPIDIHTIEEVGGGSVGCMLAEIF